MGITMVVSFNVKQVLKYALVKMSLFAPVLRHVLGSGHTVSLRGSGFLSLSKNFSNPSDPEFFCRCQ